MGDNVVDLSNISSDDEDGAMEEAQDVAQVVQEMPAAGAAAVAGVARLPQRVYPGHGEFYTVTLPGKPQAMPRPEFIAWNDPRQGGKLVRAVKNPKKDEIIETRALIKSALMEKYNLQENDFPLQDLDGADGVIIELSFHRRLANHYFTAGQRHRPLKGRYQEELNQYPSDTNIPDIDNMAKFYLDSLGGVAYGDDGAVVKLTCFKGKDDVPPHDGRTVIKFRDFDPEIDEI